MSEKMPISPIEVTPHENKFEGQTEGSVSYGEYQSLAEKVENILEVITFPGINDLDYQKLKAASEEFPDFVTHIDDLIERFETEGIKVVREKGHVFVLPYLSSDIDRDSVYPWYLKVKDDMDPELRALIEAGNEPHLPRKEN